MYKKLVVALCIVTVILISTRCLSTRNKHGLIYESDNTVWLLHTTQKTKEPLLQRTEFGPFSLALSHTLTRVAYSADKYNLWIANVDGTDAKEVIADQLREAGLGVTRLSWSPSDKRLAVWGTPDVDPQANLDKMALYVVDLPSNTIQSITTCVIDYGWTRDGEHLVVRKAFCPDETNGIYLIAASGSVVKQLFEGQDVASIAVSQVKDEMAFAVAGSENEGHLFIANLSSGDITELSIEFPLQSIEDLAWSPDGKYLALLATLLESNSAISTLLIVDTQTEVIRKLAQDIRGPIAWSPTGHAIATTVLSSTQGLYQVSLETSDIQKLTDDRLLTPMTFQWR